MIMRSRRPRRTSPGITESVTALTAVAVAALLSACTGAPEPSAPKPSSGSVQTSTAAPAAGGWEAYREATGCDPNAHPVVTPPDRPVGASTAVDGCRLLVTSPHRLTAVSAAGSVIELDELGELDYTDSVAATPETVWVTGTSGGAPVLLALTAGRRSKVALPPGTDVIGAVVATAGGTFVLANVGEKCVLLRVEGARTKEIGRLPGGYTAFAAEVDQFLATVVKGRSADIAVGDGRRWRTKSMGTSTAIGIRGVAAENHLLVVAANRLVQGVPSGGLFLVSRDQGRSWVSHELDDAEVTSVAVAGRNIIVSMTRQGNPATVYRSTDGGSWTAVSTESRSDGVPDLHAAGNTVWLLGQVITRLTVDD
jgi:hypothetical protein